MDPFEEYEFKPITQGLGFHDKAAKLKEEVRKVEMSAFQPAVPPMPSFLLEEESHPAQLLKTREYQDLKRQRASLYKELEVLGEPLGTHLKKTSDGLELTSTLPRVNEIPEPAPVTPSLDINEIFPPLKKPEIKLQTTMKRQLSHYDVRKKTRIIMSGAFSAAFVDALVVLAFILLYMIGFIAMTQMDVVTQIIHPAADPWALRSLGVLVLFVWVLYMLLTRMFFGRTLGEWAFDLKMGRDDEFKKRSYVWRVLGRFTLVLGTGMMTLPLLSYVFGKDLAGAITGLKIYNQNTSTL